MASAEQSKELAAKVSSPQCPAMDRLASARLVGVVLAVLLASCGSSSSTNIQRTAVASSARSVPPTTDNYLNGIACRSSSDCIAVGYLGEGFDTAGPDTRTLVLENTGGRWRLVSSPNAPGRAGSTLQGVTCVASRKCIAVGSSVNSGSNPLTLIEQDEGRGWAIVPSPNPSAFGGVGVLGGVGCASPTHCVAVGQYESENGNSQTLIEEDTGQGWNLVPSPNADSTDDNILDAVACASQSLCIAVGSVGSGGGSRQPLIESNSGSGWRIVPTTGVGALSGIACPTATWCVATGSDFSISSNVITEQPLIEEMTAGVWASVATPAVVGTLDEVACPNASYCVSIGAVEVAKLGASVGPVIVGERLGGHWTLAQPTDFGKEVDSFGAIACPTASRCIGAGARLVPGRYPEPRATLIAEHTSDGWTIDESPNI
jgi:hypothetical protein